MKRSVFLLLAVVGCSGSASTPATTSSASSGSGAGAGAGSSAGESAGVHKFKIGALDAAAVRDGDISPPNDGKTLGVGHTADETGALLAAHGLPKDPLHLSIQPMLVRDGAHVMLFDTGAGNASFAKAGKLPDSLRAAGVSPDAVTDVFISHSHPDHVGGLLTPAGALAFAHARVHMSAPEWESMRANTDEAKVVTAITPQVDTFAAGATILPSVAAVEVRGHTPGHSAYRITSNGESLLYVGDAMHHSIISVERPDWPVAFDQDKPTATASRQALLAQLATSHERVYAVHFPFPGLGHIEKKDATFAWQPETK